MNENSHHLTIKEIMQMHQLFVENDCFLHNEMTSYSFHAFENLIELLDANFRKLGYSGGPLEGYAVLDINYGTVVWIEDPSQNQYEAHRKIVKDYIASQRD